MVYAASTFGRDDEVIGAVIAEPDRDIITISSDGQAKRNPVSSYRAQSRNGKGTRNFKRGYEVVAVITAVDDDDLVGVSEKGVTIKVRVAAYFHEEVQRLPGRRHSEPGRRRPCSIHRRNPEG